MVSGASGDTGAAEAITQGGITSSQIAGASKPGESAAQTAARLYKVKIDGAEVDVDEAELLRGYSHQKAASREMQQAKKQREMAEAVIEDIRTNPRNAFSKLGVDARAFAEALLREEMEEAMLSPEQKEMRDLRKFKDEISQREEAARQEQQRLQEEAYRETIAAELQGTIINALETADLPKNEFTVSRMAFYLESCIQAGYDAKPQDVVSYVKNEYDRELRAFLSSVPEDKLLTFVGPDFTKKVVKQHIAATGAKKKAPSTAKVGIELESQKPQGPKNPRDFFRQR
jgi:hypothetical protein